MKQILRASTYLLAIIFIILYFWKGHLRGIDNPSLASSSDPIQKEITDQKKITFEGDGFIYEATPLFDYIITGVVVSKKNYNTLGSSGIDKSVPFDLCIVWGENVNKQTYLSGIKFRQDQRFCFYNYSAETKFYHEQLSNNHLLIKDDNVYKTEKSINIGDEVQISGKLVNVLATRTDKDSGYFTWETSTARTDSGSGACEVILVDSINIVQRANPFAYYGLIISLYLLLIILATRIILFIFTKEI